MFMKKAVCIMVMIMLLFIEVSCLAEEITYEIPELDKLFEAQTVRLRELWSDEARVYAFYGPGKNYYDGHGYQPRKQGKITAYFNEGGWVLVDLKYQTAKERYLYIQDSAFTALDGVQKVEEMQYFEGSIVNETQPRLGPSTDFISEDTLRSVPAGTAIKIFFKAGDYVFAEFAAGNKMVRMWIPEADTQIMAAGTFVPVERERLPVLVSELPVGEWSDWMDQYIEPGDSIEVETRTLYRRKTEIQDWTPWISGDPPRWDDERIEIRYVEVEPGEFRTEWREFWYHYHYGNWSDWSEDFWYGVASSSDIVDSKIQYRYRRIK